MEYTGRKVAIGLAPEDTRGTAEANATYWLNHMSLGFYVRAEKALNESALGNLHTHNDSTTMTRWAEGDFEGKAGDQSIGMLLFAATGSIVTTDNADLNAAVKDHTATFSQSNSPQSFTVFRVDPNSNEAFALGMINSLELSAELGGWVMVSGSLVAKPGAAATATVARIQENEFKPKHITVQLAPTVAGLGVAPTVGTIQSVRLTIERSVERDMQMSTDTPYDISVREIEISGEIVLRHSDDTYRDAFLNDTQQAMRITMKNTDVTIGTAANPTIQIDLPKVTFDNWEIDQGLGDKVNQTIGFKALYDVSSGGAATFVVTNLVASYAA